MEGSVALPDGERQKEIGQANGRGMRLQGEKSEVGGLNLRKGRNGIERKSSHGAGAGVEPKARSSLSMAGATYCHGQGLLPCSAAWRAMVHNGAQWCRVTAVASSFPRRVSRRPWAGWLLIDQDAAAVRMPPVHPSPSQPYRVQCSRITPWSLIHKYLSRTQSCVMVPPSAAASAVPQDGQQQHASST